MHIPEYGYLTFNDFPHRICVNRQITTSDTNLVVAYLTDARLTTVARREGYVSSWVYNLFLTPVHDWIQDCIRDWTQEWDLALNTSTVGPVWPPKAAWYIPCLIWSRGGASGRSDDGWLIWVVGWVCGRGCGGVDFETGVLLGAHDGNLLGR